MNIEFAQGHQIRPGDRILITLQHEENEEDQVALANALLELGQRWGVEFAAIWGAEVTVIHAD